MDQRGRQIELALVPESDLPFDLDDAVGVIVFDKADTSQIKSQPIPCAYGGTTRDQTKRIGLDPYATPEPEMPERAVDEVDEEPDRRLDAVGEEGLQSKSAKPEFSEVIDYRETRVIQRTYKLQRFSVIASSSAQPTVTLGKLNSPLRGRPVKHTIEEKRVEKTREDTNDKKAFKEKSEKERLKLVNNNDDKLFVEEGRPFWQLLVVCSTIPAVFGTVASSQLSPLPVFCLAIVYCALICAAMDITPSSVCLPKNATNFIARRQNASRATNPISVSSILIATTTAKANHSTKKEPTRRQISDWARRSLMQAVTENLSLNLSKKHHKMELSSPKLLTSFHTLMNLKTSSPNTCLLRGSSHRHQTCRHVTIAVGTWTTHVNLKSSAALTTKTNGDGTVRRAEVEKSVRRRFVERRGERCGNINFAFIFCVFTVFSLLQMTLYHGGQQAKAMLESMERRDVQLFNMKRRAEAKLKAPDGPIPQRIFVPRDVVLTTQIQIQDHASMLTLDISRDSDSVLKIRKDLDVLMQFADGSEMPTLDGRRPRGYTNVTLKGPINKIEPARARLQQLIPITVALPIDMRKMRMSFRGHDHLNKIMALKDRDGFIFPKVTVDIRHGPSPYARIRNLIIFTAAYGQSDQIVECVTKYRSILYKEHVLNREREPVVGAIMDIPSEMRGFLCGKPDGVIMRMIGSMTGSLIHFPSVANVEAAKADEMPRVTYNYYFSGKISGVISCIKIFQEALPVSLKWDVDEDDLIEKVRVMKPDSDGSLLNHFDEDWDIYITVNKNPLGGEKLFEEDGNRYTVVLTTVMANLTRLYGYRRALMKSKAPRRGPHIYANLGFDYTGSDALRTAFINNTKYGCIYSLDPKLALCPQVSSDDPELDIDGVQLS
ncbi:hypothetical protein L596_000509 [Steinernema carpocapsae]|uniref:Uncharacterized protein n=1 Tax=Steinernema carpocapsae TaxID=34508 RepID=A0A4U8UIE5_STECR|nr:hypothetical protein L596_000509 [Steinernema carpocapsae]